MTLINQKTTNDDKNLKKITLKDQNSAKGDQNSKLIGTNSTSEGMTLTIDSPNSKDFVPKLKCKDSFLLKKRIEESNADLYCWHETDGLKNDKIHGNVEVIEKMMVKYLKSIKISQVCGKPLLNIQIDLMKRGTTLYWIQSSEQLKFIVFNNPNLTLILPIKLMIEVDWKCLEDVKKWMETQIHHRTQKICVVIKSAYEPMVLNDLVVISVTKSPVLKEKISAIHKSQQYSKMAKKFKALKTSIRKIKDENAIELSNMEKRLRIEFQSKLQETKNDIKNLQSYPRPFDDSRINSNMLEFYPISIKQEIKEEIGK